MIEEEENHLFTGGLGHRDLMKIDDYDPFLAGDTSNQMYDMNLYDGFLPL